MAEKRKDAKGRNLKDGEDQMPDGRYRYRYKDLNGERRAIYSWRLVDTDRAPTGKKSGESLRAKEKALTLEQIDEIDGAAAAKHTVNDMFDKYIALSSVDLKLKTLNGYRLIYDLYVRGSIGKRKIGSVKYTDIRAFYNTLMNEKGLGINTLANINKVLDHALKIAVKDRYIRDNPNKEVYREVKKGYKGEQKARRALTEREQELFVDYLRSSDTYRRWLPLFTVFLGTGCRVGELIGLTWEDCNLQNRQISINHNTQYERMPDGKMGFYVTTPKTKAGTRTIQMMDEVHAALLHERKRQMLEGHSTVEVDGYKDFVFPTSTGGLICPTNLNKLIRTICDRINAEQLEIAERENREPEQIEYFSVHNLRHTFCARLCENETNVKAIQEIMGHVDIGTTMNVYAEVTEKRKQEAIYNLQGKIRIS